MKIILNKGTKKESKQRNEMHFDIQRQNRAKVIVPKTVYNRKKFKKIIY